MKTPVLPVLVSVMVLALALGMLGALAAAVPADRPAETDVIGLRSSIVIGMPAMLKNADAIRSRLANATADENMKLRALSRERLRQLAGADPAQARAALKMVKVKSVPRSEIFRKRGIAGPLMERAMQNLAAAMEKHANASTTAADKKRSLLQLNTQYQGCRSSNSTECESVKARVFAEAKNFTLASYDKAIGFMNTLKARLESSDFINSTNAQSAIADVDAALALLNNGRSDAEAATNLSQVKQAAAGLKRIVAKVNYIAKLESARVFRAHVSEVFERARHLERRMELIVAKINESGGDASGLEARLSTFSAKIESARAKMNASLTAFREAVALRNQAKADGNVSEAESSAIQDRLRYARAYAKEAQALLREAHAILMETARDARLALRGQVRAEDLIDADANVTVVDEPAQAELEEVDTDE